MTTHLRLAFLYTGRLIPVSFCFARSWRFSQVPRLPFYAHAPIEIDSGGIPAFAIACWRFMPSSQTKLSAFPVTITGYPCSPYGPQIYNFRSSVTRPTHSLHLASNTPYWICMQVHYRQGGYSHLMGLGQFYTRTHWVTTANFTASVSIPKL